MSSTQSINRRRRTRIALAVVGAALVCLSAFAAVSPASAAAKVQTRISPGASFDAPIGRKGGLTNPVAYCSNYQDPTTTWTIENVDTGWTRTWTWGGSLPGLYNPRVPVGTYTSKATAKCRGSVKTRNQKLQVAEKTLNGTVSRPEWKRIHRGMTRQQVTRIVGNRGRDPFRYDGKVTYTYDMMQFWRWSNISYRNGKVLEKYWNVDHD